MAGDLLAAADQHGSRLNGVTVAEARLRAADLLIAADRDRAAAIARQVLQGAGVVPEDKLTAVSVLARAGGQQDVEALAAQARSALQDLPAADAIINAVSLVFDLADGGQSELAARVADEAAAFYARWKAGWHPGRPGYRSEPYGTMVETARTVAARREDEWLRLTRQRAAEPGMQPATLPPWPALSGSCLLWWPQEEYQRIVRQVPEMRSVLGATWRNHTAKVESAMLALVPAGPVSRQGGATGYSLLAADFESFCNYLRETGADPRQATAMTGFTAHLIGLAEKGAPGTRQPTPWPPARRSRCWCGSNARYRRCHQRHG